METQKTKKETIEKLLLSDRCDDNNAVSIVSTKCKNYMKNKTYILEPYTGQKSRYSCPNCKKSKEFTRYIETGTGEPLDSNVGRCNRADKCGYHYTPKMYFDDNNIYEITASYYPIIPSKQEMPSSFIDDHIVDSTLIGYESNNFIKYLESIFGRSTVQDLISIFYIGSSSRYGGGTTVFWQIDHNDCARTGKLIKYNEKGNRIKKCNNWVHSILGLKNFNLNQCLFGEHLLKILPDYTVGLVESEKTAVIMQAKIPSMIWLASGGIEGLNRRKLSILVDRKVILFPDASETGSVYNKWKGWAKLLGFEISDYLESNTNDEQKSNGVDLADMIN